ncbi:MAG: helix-hairpin-helix domain-containing protein [Chloroflexota bacterium]
MNFWIVLLIGIILGWLIEWLIDWFFWRRDSGSVVNEEQIRMQILEESDTRVADVEARWQAKMNETAQQWQTRLNALVQQQQSRISALEASNRELQAQLDAGVATTTAAASSSAMPGIYPAAAVGAVAAAVVTEEIVDKDVDIVEVVEEEVIIPDVSTYPTDVWRGEYFNNLSLRGAPVLVREDADIDFDWSKSPPAPSINPDQFSVRWTRMVDLEKARYRFSVTSDDGARLWVNDELLVDDWTDHPAKTLNRDISLPGGPVPVRLEYFENAYDSMIRLAWDRAAKSDLTKIRGIGPKFAATLNEGGITTYDDLAAATPEQLDEIIQPADWQRQQIDFPSWIAQAEAMTRIPGQITTGDDLTELEGIGPTYAARLRDAGITTFAQLAVTNEEALAETINVPAWRKLNYSDWIAQARLKVAGDDSGLKALQDELFKRETDYDNLELIYGIGEKSSKAIRAAGITTFAALAEAQPERLETIMQDAGIPSGDYAAWIDEAALRAAGKRVRRSRKKVTELVSCPQDLSAVAGIGSALEDRLYTAGVGSYWELAETPDDELSTVISINDADELSRIKSSAMQMAVQTNTLGRAWDGTPPDDFEVLEGIGEIFERRLYQAGICTYEALAAQTIDLLQDVCKAPDWNMPNYAAWIAKASELAAAKRSD